MAGFAVDVMMVHTEAGRSRTSTQRHCTTGGMMTGATMIHHLRLDT